MSKKLGWQEERIRESQEKNQHLYLEMVHYKDLAGTKAKVQFARQKEALSDQLSLFDGVEAEQEAVDLEEKVAEKKGKAVEKVKWLDVRLEDDYLIDRIYAEEERKIKESSPSYEETARQGNERDLPILKELEPYIGSFKDKPTD